MKNQKNLIHLTCTKNKYQGLYITKIAFLKINNILYKSKNKALKLMLIKSGCFGSKYKISLLDQLLYHEILFQKDQTYIFVNKKDIIFIDNTIIDFTKNNFHQSFQFYNSNIKEFCGCKKSFIFK
ncbi:iron-sulfur cluster assembly accessory protein [Enterobacteriaceae endosymbiont of Donacia provostii]|uniref:HesB/IscA family protein n=1 Tax=Enterobacteriaceae endosymbiont of Donacia provostii TaxID=2675781 RepID=UPI001449FEE0|nr:iron-sulfur cluster assembly accessory protein [Enterobacteriaceae endosymbiont of Donacia provostii]QJC33821.1 iron-sulfur cluster assembly accessory protein [Enterobacteriaceae endosymbiont of Donacia provostii]